MWTASHQWLGVTSLNRALGVSLVDSLPLADLYLVCVPSIGKTLIIKRCRIKGTHLLIFRPYKEQNITFLQAAHIQANSSCEHILPPPHGSITWLLQICWSAPNTIVGDGFTALCPIYFKWCAWDLWTSETFFSLSVPLVPVASEFTPCFAI